MRFSVLIYLVAPLLTVTAVAVPPDDARDIRPILLSHCSRCHGEDVQEGGVRLDNLSMNVTEDRAAAETWHEVLNVLGAGEMPPEDEPPLSAEQLNALTTWVRHKVDQAIAAARQSDGRVVLRRLSRTAYQNTMRDLLGLDMDYARDLPPDAISADGFTNDGRSLQMSSLHLEIYLDAARRAMDRAIVTGDAPQAFHHEFSETTIDKWKGNAQRSNRLGRQQEFLAKMKDDYPEQGEFLIRVTFTADLLPNTGFPLLEVSLGYQPDTQILLRDFDAIEITQAQEQTLEFRGLLEEFPLPVRGQGKFPGLVVRVRNVYDDGSPRPKEEKKDKKPFYPDEPSLPKIEIVKVEFHGPVFDEWPTETHRRILPDSPLRQSDETAYAHDVISGFMTRAYRRPVSDEELSRITRHYDRIRPEFPSLEEAMRETLSMVLIQPAFLYLLEPAGDAKRAVNDWELASRLSYFLWSTMPDETLLQLADQGRLKEGGVLQDQVERMLADPRSGRFTSQFSDQWLHLDGVDRVSINRDYYPGFDDALKESMRGESRALFAEILRENSSVLQMLDSDFTMLNEPLAKHYGVADVYGIAFRRVSLSEQQHRGGLLGHGSILLSNSTGTDSHAVRRAVWIRDRLLGDPPAPPPPDVPSLEEADPKFHELSVREQLAIHRGKPACAGCHRNIDPWGIALENFDAVGLWREKVRRQRGKKFETAPVQASDTLPGGIELSGVDALRTHLLNEHRDDFARALVKRLLSYALGRPVELSDEQDINDITGRFIADDYRLRNLVFHVVQSSAFQTK